MCDNIRNLGLLERCLDFLTTSLRNLPERHSSLRAVLDDSWELLFEAEYAVLMGLSVFRSGFDFAAAECVADASLAVLAPLISTDTLTSAPDT